MNELANYTNVYTLYKYIVVIIIKFLSNNMYLNNKKAYSRVLHIYLIKNIQITRHLYTNNSYEFVTDVYYKVTAEGKFVMENP